MHDRRKGNKSHGFQGPRLAGPAKYVPKSIFEAVAHISQIILARIYTPNLAERVVSRGPLHIC